MMAIHQRVSKRLGVAAALSLAALAAGLGESGVQPAQKPPPIVTPGPLPGSAPSDAKVLFDGSSLVGWTTRDGKAAGWSCDQKPGGAMTVAPGGGDIVSRETFGSAQIHVEFMTPATQGAGQDRGNSGVYIHGRYEVQVLDSFRSQTYPDGQCGAVYKQHAPLVNACRPPGEWQTYDMVFHAPVFDADGKKTAPARLTVLHNGVMIHNNVELRGPTGGAAGEGEKPAGPLLLQEHGHEVRFRNIWVRSF